MAGDIFTLDADNNAVVRTVPVNAAASETNSPVIFTTDEDGNTAVRTVSVNAGASETNSPVIFTTDENGNAAVRVVGAGGGSTPVIDELNVTPSTSAQTITAPSSVDGYSPVNVAAVTSAIDANIVAENIKKDVEILGVTGSYEGVAPSGTKSITSNGIHDVAGYANADVQVPTTAPAHYVEKTVDANGKLINSTNIIDLTGVTDLGDYVLNHAYYLTSFPANTSIDLSSLTTISGLGALEYAFQQGQNLNSVDLSSLTTISGSNACYSAFNAAHLTSVNLSSLTTVSGSNACYNMLRGEYFTTLNLSNLTTISGYNGCRGMCGECPYLTSVDLSSLTTISGNYACQLMFETCTSLTSVVFSSLTTLTGQSALNGAFQRCSSLTSISFPALKSTSFGSNKNQLQSMLANGVTNCTLHFPSNLDPAGGSTVISSLIGYPNFDGTNTVLAFDLPATES